MGKKSDLEIARDDVFGTAAAIRKAQGIPDQAPLDDFATARMSLHVSLVEFAMHAIEKYAETMERTARVTKWCAIVSVASTVVIAFATLFQAFK